ncbi:MAG: hypothetical protein JWR67_2365 [Mucilaginibacter sp.]|jgi:hypothetical protein|nr:hypothetical protein [Mucilaginibacter sp.]
MAVFSIKMVISVAPLFLSLNNKTVTAVIKQLELDGKSEKDNTEKDSTEKDNAEKSLVKDKKFFDENMVYSNAYTTILTQTNVLHNQEHSLYVQLHHPIVPTPPPNV